MQKTFQNCLCVTPLHRPPRYAALASASGVNVLPDYHQKGQISEYISSCGPKTFLTERSGHTAAGGDACLDIAGASFRTGHHKPRKPPGMTTQDVAPAAWPVIDADAVLRLTPMPALIAALCDIFRSNCTAPPRHSHNMSPTTSLLLMPAWRDDGAYGIKLATIHTDTSPTVRATYLLMSSQTGATRAILDGGMLTARRTAAASALAASYLSRPDSHTLLILGTGTLVPHLIEAHAANRPIERILIWGRNPARAAAAVEAARAAGPYEAHAVADLTAALAMADIVSAATLATHPLIPGSMLRQGMHVDLIGAFRPDMAEADPECFRRAEVFVDTREGVMAEAGDLLQAIAVGAFDAADIKADLAALCLGRHPGRESGDAITLFKSVGSSLEDLAAAELVLDRWSGADA